MPSLAMLPVAMVLSVNEFCKDLRVYDSPYVILKE